MKQNAALLQLKQMLNAMYPLPAEVWHDVAGIWQPVKVKRKTLLTTCGAVEKHLYFVTEGVQRVFTITPSDREATLVFTYPFSFSGIIDSLLLQKPSAYYLETLTQSSLLSTTFGQLQPLMERHPAFNTLIRLSLTHVVQGLLQRQVELQCYSAEQKFTTLLHRSPHILQLIPHKYLASYLGVDAATFSKLLGSVRL